MRRVGPEAQKNWDLRQREGFFDRYLRGGNILDIGFRGNAADAVPIADGAIGVDLDYPGYDGVTLPFSDQSQDAVFVSHCLEHIANYRNVLADWYRVLRVGGHLLIMVPHRDLYERKASLPSRFNEDHKRFYTPASLLGEIEQALPVGGFRVRSLRDLDGGFDYATSPEIHAKGSYEIELVVQKIALPAYAQKLRPTDAQTAHLQECIAIIQEVSAAESTGDANAIHACNSRLATLELPIFPVLIAELNRKREASEPASTAPYSVTWLRKLLAPHIAGAPFEEAFYIQRYGDIAKAVATEGAAFAHKHYIRHGYFEGRYSHPSQLR
jgi:SAM-dependent methyltransferase